MTKFVLQKIKVLAMCCLTGCGQMGELQLPAKDSDKDSSATIQHSGVLAPPEERSVVVAQEKTEKKHQ